MIHTLKPVVLPGLQSPIECIGREIDMNIRMDLSLWHMRHTIRDATRYICEGWLFE